MKQYKNTRYFVTENGEVFHNEKKLKPYKQTKGYLRVDIWEDNKRKTIYVHRMVMETFKENPLNHPQINHIDGDKENNKLENLEWASFSDNMKHRSHVLGKNIGDNTPSIKIPDKEVLILRWKKSINYPINIKETAKKWGVRVDYLRKVINGKQRIYLNDSWELDRTTKGKDNHTTPHCLECSHPQVK
jgi:hypothetical protein